ncbi:hypothetical protein A2V56_04435 [Candidatus Woesebacteria bacterium RBG_19FT_COMBO_42_9]|uniref:Uncharacterized protein n=1 Tax=Candidatus Woesebacteria bacterium RBG_16_42_24 TaxID=1802485 RepID=A0A1F7XLQ4_9BACT|nr:MAG: hypothetical protein A2V97_04420 [Candidatus Woesebacteria bacterium RBG_16_42_24]OGM16213.1 MAG: hypothetical protein A2V56_04435 [Candidatus Woesebacteria bacterium RBG_19FT_COMBO_42_9]OGM68504.1 MAG: hypothetical protein A2985_04010 [Candidatus Woesebacteria bacterium RIFCSPLOWO2_01_FULL_43_11]
MIYSTRPEFKHFSCESEKVDSDPLFWKFKVIDPHIDSGLGELLNLIGEYAIQERDISNRSYISGSSEITNLANFFESSSLPSDKEHLASLVVQKVRERTTYLSEEDIRETVEHGPLLEDYAFLIGRLKAYKQNPALLEQNSRFIFDPIKRRLDLYLGPDEHRLLAMSRVLGLIPFSAIERLRETKIRVMGASVAASTIETLVALGAENIVFYDYGFLDPAKMPQMPGGMGDFRNSGEPKVKALMELVQGRNPYGIFLGIPGKVLIPGEAKQSEFDVYLDEIIDDADLLIEVVDQYHIKAGTRAHSDKPIVFVADLGSDPIAGIEDPKLNLWFNREISDEDKARMSKIPASREEAIREGPRAIYLMVNKDLNDDHRLQFLLASLGLIPFWSQTPTSTRESAALASKLIIEWTQNSPVMGKNIHPNESPKTLIEMFNAKTSLNLRRICAELLDIPPSII